MRDWVTLLRTFLFKVKPIITFLVQRICPLALWPCVTLLSNHGRSFLGVFPPLRVAVVHNASIGLLQQLVT